MSISTKCITLANGVQMPQIGLGVYESRVGSQTEDAVKWALQGGYRHVDTASIYENEESVGLGLKASGVPRVQVFITTKLWNADQGYESTLATFERSRKKLGADYIDLYLIHWPGNKYLDTWRAFEKLYADKKVRAIGVANFEPHHLEDTFVMCTVRPMVNQVELNPRNRQKSLRDFCAEHNIAVTAHLPLETR